VLGLLRFNAAVQRWASNVNPFTVLRSIERMGHRQLDLPPRRPRWAIRILIAVVLTIALCYVGLSLQFQLRYGTYAWWSAPLKIEYCGWTYDRLPSADLQPVPPDLGTVLTLLPSFHTVLAGSPDSDLRVGKCPDLLFYGSGDGTFVEYALPTV
jgi:hypothetical protein